jgi:hypothetical protein
MFVADSESSSIRAVNMRNLQTTRNVIGGDSNPRNLHSFGDKDGINYEAKLQHPLGVHFVHEKNVVLVADTYNHKIKVVDPFNCQSFTWLGGKETNPDNTLIDGTTGFAALNEP